MKRPLRLLLILVALLGAVAVLLAHKLDLVVENSIAHYGSAMTRAKVSVDAVKIGPDSGKGSLGTIEIGNPAGFRSEYALRAEKIDVRFDLASMVEDVVIIRLIVVDGPIVNYEKGTTMTNFDAIRRNIIDYLRRVSPDQNHGKRLIVEELTICNAMAWASAPFMDGKTVSIPLLDITLRNIGAAQGGLTPGELGRELANVLEARLSRAVSFERLARAAESTYDKTGNPTQGPPVTQSATLLGRL